MNVYNFFVTGELTNSITTYLISFLNSFGDYHKISFFILAVFLIAITTTTFLFHFKKGNDLFSFIDFSNGIFRNKLVSLFIFYILIVFLFMPAKGQFVTVVNSDDVNNFAGSYMLTKSTIVEGNNIYNEDGTFSIPLGLAVLYSLPNVPVFGIPASNKGPLEDNIKYNCNKISVYSLLNKLTNGKIGSRDVFRAEKAYNAYANLYKNSYNFTKGLDSSFSYLFKVPTLLDIGIYEEYLQDRQKYLNEDVLNGEKNYYNSAVEKLKNEEQVKYFGKTNFSLLTSISDYFDSSIGKTASYRLDLMQKGLTEEDLSNTYSLIFSPITKYKFLTDHADILASDEYFEDLHSLVNTIVINGAENYSDIAENNLIKKGVMPNVSNNNIGIKTLDLFMNNMLKGNSGYTDNKNILKNYTTNFFNLRKIKLINKIKTMQIKNPLLLNTLLNLSFLNEDKIISINDEDEFARCLNKQGSLSSDIKSECLKYKDILTPDILWVKDELFDSTNKRRLLTDRQTETVKYEAALPVIKTPINGFNDYKNIFGLNKTNDVFESINKLAYNSVYLKNQELDFLNNFYKPLTDYMFFNYYFLDKDSQAYISLFQKKSKGLDNIISETTLKSLKLNITGVCDTASCPQDSFSYFKINFIDNEDVNNLNKILDLDNLTGIPFEIKKLEILKNILNNKVIKLKEDFNNGKNLPIYKKEGKNYLKLTTSLTLVNTYLNLLKNNIVSSNEITIKNTKEYINYIKAINLTNIYMHYILADYDNGGIVVKWLSPLKYYAGVLYKPLIFKSIFESMHFLDLKGLENPEEDFRFIFTTFNPRNEKDFINMFGYIKKEKDGNVLVFSKDNVSASNYYDMDFESRYNIAFNNFFENIHNAKEEKSFFQLDSFNIFDMKINLEKINNILLEIINYSKLPFNFTLNAKTNDINSSLAVNNNINLNTSYLAGMGQFENNPFILDNIDPNFNAPFTLAAASIDTIGGYAPDYRHIDLDLLGKILKMDLKNNVFAESYDDLSKMQNITQVVSKQINKLDYMTLHNGMQGSLFNVDYKYMGLYYAGQVATFFVPGTAVVKGLNGLSKSATVLKMGSKASKVINSTKIKTVANGMYRSAKLKKIKITRKISRTTLFKGGSILSGIKYTLSSVLKIFMKSLQYFLMFLAILVLAYFSGLIKVILFFWTQILFPLIFHKILFFLEISKVLLRYIKNIIYSNYDTTINADLYKNLVREGKIILFLSVALLIFIFVFSILINFVFEQLLSLSLIIFSESEIIINGFLTFFGLTVVFSIMYAIIKIFDLNNLANRFK